MLGKRGRNRDKLCKKQTRNMFEKRWLKISKSNWPISGWMSFAGRCEAERGPLKIIRAKKERRDWGVTPTYPSPPSFPSSSSFWNYQFLVDILILGGPWTPFFFSFVKVWGNRSGGNVGTRARRGRAGAPKRLGDISQTFLRYLEKLEFLRRFFHFILWLKI